MVNTSDARTNTSPLIRLIGRGPRFLATVALASTLMLGAPATAEATGNDPAFVDLSTRDLIRAVTSSDDETRSEWISGLATRVRNRHGGVVALRLGALPLTVDGLYGADRARVVEAFGSSADLDTAYQQALSQVMADVMEAARAENDALQVGVYGFPAEAKGRSLSEARSLNDNYDSMLDASDVLISSQRMARNSDDRLEETMRHANGRDVHFRTDDGWKQISLADDVAEEIAESNADDDDDLVAQLMADWGQSDSPWDLNDDGTVDNADLMILLANYDDYIDQDPDVPGLGAFLDAPAHYPLNSGLNLAFTPGDDAPDNPNVVFQVWSITMGAIEAPYPDYDAPFVYPSEALDEVTPGPALVQAIVRDADNGNAVAGVVELSLDFMATVPPDMDNEDDGGGGGEPGDGGMGNDGGPSGNGNGNDDEPYSDVSSRAGDDWDEPNGDDDDDDNGGGGNDDWGDWGDPDAPAPDPVIEIIDASGNAPFTAHVHAVESDLGVGDPLTARYEWDFGDPSGAYNTMSGFNAAHTYDDPGTYTITLTIINQAGRTTQQTTQVTVSSPNRTPVYVSNDGSDGNSGSNPNNPIRTYSHAMQIAGAGNKHIMFQRGDTFDVGGTTTINAENVVIGAYGSGDRPKIRWSAGRGTGAILQMPEDEGGDILIEDLEFTSIHASSQERNICTAFKPSGQNVTVRHCTFKHVTDAVNCERDPVGLLTYGNESPVHNGLRAYYSWVSGTDICHIGNHVNGSLHEHNIRVGGAERVNISNNDLTNDSKTCIWGMLADYVWISGNNTHDGPITIGPLPFIDNPSNRSKWFVVERNICEKFTDGAAGIETKPGIQHAIIRNNVIKSGGVPCIYVSGWADDMERTSVDVRILNNTGICEEEICRFVQFDNDTEDGMVCNNLFIAPNMVAGDYRSCMVYIEDEDLDSFQAISHNTWPIPTDFQWVGDAYHYVWPYWAHPDGYRNPEEWIEMGLPAEEIYENLVLDNEFRPAHDSGAVGHSNRFPGVFTDLTGNPRPDDGVWTSGAMEAIDP